MRSRWGIVPAAGLGTRIQPLAFSKELLPVGTRQDGNVERPRAVSEYLLERMLAGGVDRVCFVISPVKTDIVSYFGGAIEDAPICYAVQQSPNGLSAQHHSHATGEDAAGANFRSQHQPSGHYN